jgi:hypothetical protein
MTPGGAGGHHHGGGSRLCCCMCCCRKLVLSLSVASDVTVARFGGRTRAIWRVLKGRATCGIDCPALYSIHYFGHFLRAHVRNYYHARAGVSACRLIVEVGICRVPHMRNGNEQKSQTQKPRSAKEKEKAAVSGAACVLCGVNSPCPRDLLRLLRRPVKRFYRLGSVRAEPWVPSNRRKALLPPRRLRQPRCPMSLTACLQPRLWSMDQPLGCHLRER